MPNYKTTTTYSGVADVCYHATYPEALGSHARQARDLGLTPVLSSHVVLCQDEFGGYVVVQIEEVPSNEYQS